MEAVKTIMLMIISAGVQATALLQDDPCNNYKMLYDDGGRSIKCDLYYSESHDRFIDEGWRRVQLQPTGEDLNMPTQCVPHGYCGSHSNVWLNGSHPTVEDGKVDKMGGLSTHPTVEDGIVDRIGCLSTHPTVEDGIVNRMGCLSMFSSCCKAKYPIKIKNCSDYNVYNLKRTFGSDERYCFGEAVCFYAAVERILHFFQKLRNTNED
ncbi:hypothetical protein LOTGIDRAFT_239001 [Lottia gigantea]|uniref:UMOD/GP2/OIT3-like D8C domain-containing protein n=1 Tax=Lottia gigantea TaxID=225164 RepID=V4AUH8_LOTGI|nr:hypothetical protein LOTGIDRAFT_239001 [Lottia gigantea]ESO98590.1 hypothetical protein LOTGIDRAFT_239001 [Lottia gigantea]